MEAAMAHRLLGAGVAAALMVTGCGTAAPRSNPPKAVTQPLAAVIPDSAHGGPAGGSNGSPQSPSALAMKTASYARDLEAAMAKPGQPSTRTSATAAHGDARDDWMRDLNNDLTLGPRQDLAARSADRAPAPGAPTDHSAPMANQVLSLPSTQPVRVLTTSPVMIPESHDFTNGREPEHLSADELEKKIMQRLRENPRDVSAHMDYQLLRFLRDGQVPQLDAMASLPAEDRAVLTALMDGLSNFRTGVRADANMLTAKKIRPLLDMADRLRSSADLRIPTVALCTRVDAFGVYKAIDPPRFAAGREHPTIIYCEVENFSSQFNEERLWETKLTMEALLFTETGMLVWQDVDYKTKPVIDHSVNRRHDFYIAKMARIPANLTIGRYLLKVTVVDQQASRIAETTVPIQIVAQ
jgi:hypothetical protein